MEDPLEVPKSGEKKFNLRKIAIIATGILLVVIIVVGAIQNQKQNKIAREAVQDTEAAIRAVEEAVEAAYKVEVCQGSLCIKAETVTLTGDQRCVITDKQDVFCGDFVLKNLIQE